MKYLLDSDVVASAIKGRLPVVLKLSALKPGDVAVSAISRVEAETALRAQPRVQAKYARLLREFLAQVDVVGFGAAEAQAAATLAVSLKSEGAPLAPFDLLVAATAQANQMTLVTDRPNAFAAIANLDVENWN